MEGLFLPARRVRSADASAVKQVLASVKHEQGRLDEALQLLRQSMKLWWKAPREAASWDNTELGNGHVEVDDDEEMHEDLHTPSFEFRFECAKLLIQLDETTETAVEVHTLPVEPHRPQGHLCVGQERNSVIPSLQALMLYLCLSRYRHLIENFKWLQRDTPQ